MHQLWSTPDFRTLLVRIFLGVSLALLSLLVLLRPLPPSIRAMARRTWDRRLFAAFAGVRILLFVLLYLVLHQPVRGDLPSYYMPDAELTLQGCNPYSNPIATPQSIAAWKHLPSGSLLLPCTPYRDFRSSYAPLNPLLDATLLRIHDSPLSLLAFYLLCDILSLPMWIGFLRRFLPEEAVRSAGLLLLLQPILLWNSVMNGRNDCLLSLLLAAAVYLVGRRDALSGITATASLVLVKFLPIIYLPGIFLTAKHKTRWLLAALVLPAIVYGFFLSIEAPIGVPFVQEAARGTAGGLPFALSTLLGTGVVAAFWDRITALALAGVTIAVAWRIVHTTGDRAKLWVLNASLLILLFTLLVASKKMYPAYVGEVAGPLAGYVAVVCARGRKFVATVYAALISTSLFASSIWYWPLNLMGTVELHNRMLGPGATIWIIEALAIYTPMMCMIYLLTTLFRDLRNPAEA